MSLTLHDEQHADSQHSPHSKGAEEQEGIVGEAAVQHHLPQHLRELRCTTVSRNESREYNRENNQLWVDTP